MLFGVHFQIYILFLVREGRSQKGASLRRHENNDLQQNLRQQQNNFDNQKTKNVTRRKYKTIRNEKVYL